MGGTGCRERSPANAVLWANEVHYAAHIFTGITGGEQIFNMQEGKKEKGRQGDGTRLSEEHQLLCCIVVTLFLRRYFSTYRLHFKK